MTSNYNKTPIIKVNGFNDHCWSGWESICTKINDKVDDLNNEKVSNRCLIKIQQIHIHFCIQYSLCICTDEAVHIIYFQGYQLYNYKCI